MTPLDFEIWYFGIHFFCEKMLFAVIYELLKRKVTMVETPGKNPSAPMVELKIKTRYGLIFIDSNIAEGGVGEINSPSVWKVDH